MSLTPEKTRRLKSVSTAPGVIAALALDQRGSLADLMERASGQAPHAGMIERFKSAVTRVLTPYASGILLDLEYGRQAIARRAPSTGLMLAYEMDAYINRTPHRTPQLIPNLSLQRLKENGADCAKLLIHYHPDAPDGVNDVKCALVERVGAECAAEDIPFFLEVLGYDLDGAGQESAAYARRKPDIVIANMAEFSRQRYGVDILKVEFPVNLKYTAGTESFAGEAVYSREEALEWYRKGARASAKPFIYLSAGVTHAEFIESLCLAAEAGVSFSGVLCGRAIWQEGARLYALQGPEALEDWLETKGRQNIQAVAACLENARPWCFSDSQPVNGSDE